MALGTHGVGHHLKVRLAESQKVKEEPELTPTIRKPNYHDYNEDYMPEMQER